MTEKKIVKALLPLDHIAALTAISSGARMSVSGLIAKIIADRLSAGDGASLSDFMDGIRPSEYKVNDTVRYEVVMPLSIMGVIDARAKDQGLSRKRYVASLLTSHASCEPIYDRSAQSTIEKTLDKVHSMAISLNMLRHSIESRGVMPKNIDAELLTVKSLCENLLSEVNQMRLANVERWRST
ncbi:MAG: hypothetical protein B7X43_00645 [Thiomonas sp. 15-63-373]|jgi:hypothetical protein|nr:MAG: hypothetical protein B7X43_00645 [Thiomonas sp. 15-63-373]